MGAHLVGGGAHRGRDQDQRSVRQVRLRGHLRFHGRWRKPALLEREALRRGHQHPQCVGAGLLSVLPAPHGRLASGLRRRQAQQPVVLRLQRLGLLLYRQSGDLARALGHRPIQLLGGHRRPRPGRAAQPPGGPAHRGHRPPLHPGRRQGRGMAAHPPRHRCGPAAHLDPLDPREREVRRGLLPHLDEHALPYQPRDAPHAEGDRGGLARHRCRLCGMGSREERPGGRGVPHERGALPGAVRHLRGQRHAVRHGRPAPEGVLRGVDA